MRKSAIATMLLALSTILGCGTGEEDYGVAPGDIVPVEHDGKEDAVFGRKALPVNLDTSRTNVWTVQNRWEDRNTPAARKAGIAWGENSGLNWDEKYAAWIKAMPKVDGGWFKTYEVTTPWGRKIGSPSLECAETAIVLRITFAAWYQLPFFMEAQDARGNRIYFGHFGVRTATGRYANMPEFSINYRDYSSRADLASNWPTDSRLMNKKISDSTDDQPALDGAHFGAYLDAIHANKRVGHFTMIAVEYLGSVNVGDSANTYNLVPEALREGDVLVERWQRVGIGHTLIVKRVAPLDGGRLEAELVSGSMPRRQGKWETPAGSKGYFTLEETGGVGESSDGTPYAKLGGGLKRWRVAKSVNGNWVNTFMQGDESKWINSTDYARISARPSRLEDLLGEMPPEQTRDAMLAIIEDARGHLSRFPASCSARTRREQAFAKLYEVNAQHFHLTHEQTDRQYRKLEDYVLRELDYTTSKTCCWNSTNTETFAVIMDYAQSEQVGQCSEPTVFRANGGGYDTWARHAASIGKRWVAWSEDEPCAQRNVADDTVLQTTALQWCEVQQP